MRSLKYSPTGSLGLGHNFFRNFRLCEFQLDNFQFAPKIIILNPSGYWTTGTHNL